ncbi:DUF2589 domain-containing protein [Nocardioides sp. MAH-18]|uniref:DUF2589 domain-containing protein n=1 Tax=Nocardioides agri TaxID=2682843 RepID=A0A6L6XXT4_9ACTN|nr:MULTISPECIES: DUF2589 domain-containing protein [unclassified Nocardioides]MBA2952887.1 DUF2589 domain-containing protein [Nocardioides sp. CGMCC 1.13656]MVQ52049.1 DUF2589 domain-containing protein [Nocardioides sp. MAH-18]
MPVTDVRALGLGELLGSLLSAVVEGQTAATGSSLDFVQQVGLTGDPDHPSFTTVPIRYTKLDENQEPAQYELELPLLALVNIPTLTVKQARIAFTYDVVTTTRETTTAEEEASQPTIGQLKPLRPVSLVGYVPRRTTTSRTTDSNARTGIDVEVTVESQALPLGLERILELTELAQSRPVEEDQ